MKNDKDRREALLRTADGLQRELFAVRIRELEDKYSRPDVIDTLYKAVEDLFRLWEQDDSRQIGSIGIGYLYSSMVMRTYELQLTLYGEDFYLEEHPVSVGWKPLFFFEIFEEDMTVIMGKLKREYPRIYPYEEEAVRLWCIEYYLAAIRQLCADRMEEMIRQIWKDKGSFYVFFGRYGGEGEILFHIKDKDTEAFDAEGELHE